MIHSQFPLSKEIQDGGIERKWRLKYRDHAKSHITYGSPLVAPRQGMSTAEQFVRKYADRTQVSQTRFRVTVLARKGRRLDFLQ